jgi:hypothetical protein
MRPGPEDDTFSEEIKREDGLERYWLFCSGEWVQTIFGLLAATAAILWCFLYVLGYGETLAGCVFGWLAFFGFVGWYFVSRSLQRYESSGWRKGRRESTKAEKWEIGVAAGLWIFILLSVETLILMQRR